MTNASDSVTGVLRVAVNHGVCDVPLKCAMYGGYLCSTSRTDTHKARDPLETWCRHSHPRRSNGLSACHELAAIGVVKNCRVCAMEAISQGSLGGSTCQGLPERREPRKKRSTTKEDD